ncbi:MAG: hypothetical protein AAF501_00465 [Pseudomonadota bacterium]
MRIAVSIVLTTALLAACAGAPSTDPGKKGPPFGAGRTGASVSK